MVMWLGRMDACGHTPWQARSPSLECNDATTSGKQGDGQEVILQRVYGLRTAEGSGVLTAVDCFRDCVQSVK